MAQEIYHRSEWGNPNEQWGNVYLNADLTNELYKRASEYENSWVTDQLLNGVGTKPSIILTPTAYEDGKLLSVKPSDGNADFDFTRGSSATRVNELGLVQDVQLLSGELVQNGNFEQIGSERVTNGDFSDGSTDWLNPDVAATFSNDSVTIVGGSGNRRILQANVTSPTSSQWKLQYEITEKVGTSDLRVYTTSGYSIIPSTVGIHTYYFNSSLTDFYFNFSNSAGSITIDNVSVKEVGQNWSVVDSDANNFVEFTQGQARLKFLNTSPITVLRATAPFVSGKKYKLIVDVANVASGSIKVANAGINETFDTVGISTRIINPTGTSNIEFYRASANVDITLNSVSLIEITDDTDLPRINYTNFDYENGEVVPYSGEGSLLLENQSTNLITYSEDFSQSDWIKSNNPTITSNIAIAPDGTQTANGIQDIDAANLKAISQSFSVNSNSTATISIFVKKELTNTNFGGLMLYFSGGTVKYLYGIIDEVNGVINIAPESVFGSSSTKVEDYGTYWRFSLSGTDNGSNNTVRFQYYASFSTNGINVTGNCIGSLRTLWGAMLEEGSFPTSYIKSNSGSATTRLADVCNNSGSSDLINSTEGVLYFEAARLNSEDNSSIIFSISDGSNSNAVSMYYYSGGIGVDIFNLLGTKTILHSISLNQQAEFNKLAIKYKSNDMALWFNGNEVGTNTDAINLTGLNELKASYGNGQFPFYGNVKCLAVFKEALSDTELQCLTS